jgi:hypothetical protein
MGAPVILTHALAVMADHTNPIVYQQFCPALTAELGKRGHSSCTVNRYLTPLAKIWELRLAQGDHE